MVLPHNTLLQISVDGIVQGLYSGISFGMILVLTAAGLTLIFGLMGVVNFAHGELYAAGAYAGFVLFGVTGNFAVAVVAAVIAGFAIGAIMEVSIIRPLYDREPLYQLAVTFGAAIILIELIEVIIGPQSQPFPIPDLLSGSIAVAGYTFGTYRIFLIVAGGILVTALWLFLTKSKYGLIIRAAIFDTEMVESMGYDVNRAYTFIFGLGAAYAAIAGVLVAPLFGLFPEMGAEIIILIFVVVVVGGLGSFKGVIVAGLLIGIAQSFGQIYVPWAAEAIPFVLMVAVILYRPQGLFGVEGVFTE
ncbi:branched-chain amino acid ABC transporter permease [Salinadaptatus halalkaliphilus]|uniref:Branched-chain amino acid ABC transporter permease n=1 Tax=Salinadaptatus halalkaliphilus TaxID=2419781 RepID=A0A4S3TJF2_9EURY|nr:branched-chain amino acid ABC transporter permease [Salinadaptatus halalkaliphilus]THE63025.1 branched-chain amino acid ABC transporter permease [Salinadaptatus halalkaliphilus]